MYSLGGAIAGARFDDEPSGTIRTRRTTGSKSTKPSLRMANIPVRTIVEADILRPVPVVAAAR